MNPALFVLVIFQVLLLLVIYFAFTPVLRPVSTQSTLMPLMYFGDLPLPVFWLH